MAASVNNNNRRRPQGNRNPRRETPVEEALREEKEREMKIEIGTIVFVAVQLLLFLCNFHIIGAFGEAVSGFMFGVFGLLNYITPIVLTIGLFFYRANKGNKNAMKKLAASTGLYFLIAIICDMASKTAVGMESYSFTALFVLGKEGRCGGGLVSGSIAYLIKSWLGNVGLVLLLILGIIICLILLTERSFINMVKNKGLELIDRGRDYREERRVQREIEQREQAARLEDKRSFEEQQDIEPERALNMRDKLKNSANLPEHIVERTPAPFAPAVENPVEIQQDSYKPTVRESLRDKWNASREKRAEDRKLSQEAKENDSILQVVDNNSYYNNVYYSNCYSQEMHEITCDEKTAVSDYYQDENTAVSDYYQDENTESYVYGKDPEQSHSPIDPRLQRGDTIVDMYGRPVFNFEKQELRSEHNVVVKDEFSAIPGETGDSGEVFENDESILENGTDDVLGTYERNMRKRAEDISNAPQYTENPSQTDGNVSQSVDDTLVAAGIEDTADTEPDVRKVITPVERKRPRADVPKDKEQSGSIFDSPLSALKEEQHPEPGHNIKAEKSYGQTVGKSNNDKWNTGQRPGKTYNFPPLNLLKKGVRGNGADELELEETKRNLQQTLHSFGVNVEITEAVQGPSVTRYEMTLEPGTKVSKILGLSDDIKLSLASADIRIEAPIPGKSAVGIEVPNKETSMVALRDLFESKEFKNASSTLSFAVGKNIGGDVIVTDIGKMPHVLIAGATGSGKSVCINTLIMSLIYKSSPEDVQMIMVDPKVVELSVYNGIPHLMLPVVTDPKKASAALAWGVKEMEERYRKFADLTVRDLKGYNEKVEAMSEEEIAEASANGINHFRLPKIVIIIDELADLMMVCGKEVEEAICRLAQLARACGIHLVVATQRPSVDVITGLIKANMPSRMAFAVSSGVDSRTILDTVGAEKLLGKGDMLFYPQGKPKPERVQGAFVSDEEVSAVVDFLKAQRLHNEFAEKAGISSETLENASDGSGSKGGSVSGGSEDPDGRDELFAEAGRCIIGSGKVSIGYLQRMLKIGFNRAARIMDSLSEEGVVGPESGTKAREILMSIEEFEAYLDSK
ncbi:MAG: DNA translocase FtsK [Lachnospiraceae bacterium]|nr:DNA translocase FtsK [Lachnospiraceae bacterium]